MLPSQPFSKRHGYFGQPKEITVREDAPKDLRFAFLETTREIARAYQGQYPDTEIRDVVAKTLGKWLDPAVWHYEEAWKQVEGAVYNCEWFRVYDLIESVQGYFERTTPRAAEEFAERINDLFATQGIGWQIVNGEIVTRGDEVFERTVMTGAAALKEDAKPTAAGHLQFAISALSARPKANTSGAVTHATSAVECVLGEITGQTMTLGKYLDKYPTLFHPALKKGLDGIYGYASDEGARHGKEGIEPAREEAEFVVAACAAICTLLTMKRPK
jgi:AbiJ N-terminal domain 4